MFRFLKRFFFKTTGREEEDFEAVLAMIDGDIQKHQAQLSEIRRRGKRSTLVVTAFALFGWIVFTSLWYCNLLPSLFNTTTRNHTLVERITYVSLVFIGPIVIRFIRRIVVAWYARKANMEEKNLQNSKKQLHAKLDEFKKKTNFDSTFELVQKYDILPRGRLPQRQQRPSTHTPQLHPSSQADTSVFATLQTHLTHMSQPQVADTVPGYGSHEVGSPSPQYALNCESCFTHNGFIPPSMWEDAQFTCRNPNCNHFNLSLRSKRQVLSSYPSPPPSTSSPPDPVSQNSPSLQQRPSTSNESRGNKSAARAPPVDGNSSKSPIDEQGRDRRDRVRQSGGKEHSRGRNLPQQRGRRKPVTRPEPLRSIKIVGSDRGGGGAADTGEEAPQMIL